MAPARMAPSRISARDATLAAAQFITAIQSIASREVDPLGTAVVSVGHIAAGDAAAPNVIPAAVFLRGTARALDEDGADPPRDTRSPRSRRPSPRSTGSRAEPRYIRRLAPTVNHAAQAAVMVARRHRLGAWRCATTTRRSPRAKISPSSWRCVPGAYAWLGTGDPGASRGLAPQPAFRFPATRRSPHGAAFWCSLVRRSSHAPPMRRRRRARRAESEAPMTNTIIDCDPGHRRCHRAVAGARLAGAGPAGSSPWPAAMSGSRHTTANACAIVALARAATSPWWPAPSALCSRSSAPRRRCMATDGLGGVRLPPKARRWRRASPRMRYARCCAPRRPHP
jgi:hypothetical protein